MILCLGLASSSNKAYLPGPDDIVIPNCQKLEIWLPLVELHGHGMEIAME